MQITAIPRDTSPEAFWVQVDIYRRMTPDKRMQLALEMNASMRAVMAAGVRQQHPHYSEAQVKLVVIRLTLGTDLFQQTYPEGSMGAGIGRRRYPCGSIAGGGASAAADRTLSAKPQAE